MYYTCITYPHLFVTPCCCSDSRDSRKATADSIREFLNAGRGGELETGEGRDEDTEGDREGDREGRGGGRGERGKGEREEPSARFQRIRRGNKARVEGQEEEEERERRRRRRERRERRTDPIGSILAGKGNGNGKEEGKRDVVCPEVRTMLLSRRRLLIAPEGTSNTQVQ